MSDLINAFFGPGNELNLAAIPGHLRVQLDRWMRSLNDPNCTSFLPREAAGRLYWYVFVPTDRRANEILELLGAWIGPTYSDVAVNRGRLNLVDPFDTRIDAMSDLTMLRFEVLPRSGSARASDARRLVREALIRLTALLDSRPDSEFQLTKSTAEVLDDLGHALSARDRYAANVALAALAENGDLDTLNQTFVRVRALASLEDWDQLIDERSINDLLNVARPPGVTRAIRRAVYHRYFATLDSGERDADLLDTARRLPAPYRSATAGPAAQFPDELVFQVLLALTSDPPLPADLLQNMAAVGDELRVGLTQRLLRLISAATKPTGAHSVEISPEAAAFALYAAGDPAGALGLALDLPCSEATARIAALAAADMDDKAAAISALDYIASDTRVRSKVLGSKQIRNALWALEQAVAFKGPSDWSAWLDQIANGDSSGVVLDQVPADPSQWPVLEFADLSARVAAMGDDVLMVLGEVSGQFLAAHRDVIEAAGTAGAALARRLISALAVSMKSSSGVRSQTLSLADIAFSAGFAGTEYSETVDYINDIRQTNAASSTVEWQADLFQLVTSYPASNDEAGALDRFVSSALEQFIAFRYALSNVALRGIQLICDEYPAEFPPVLGAMLTDGADDDSRRYAYLEGKTIALYSLMDSSATRAAQLLRKLIPRVDVRLFHDKAGGSPTLEHASKNADVFVIVTAAAKHAATGFIESHRGTRDVVRVNAKGTSAIMNALREPA
ncbi:protein DpdD [Mycolicibacterium mucogenicum]|uniref:protein DpdD n=1 Tax=Mycolicibacterium mucogenicum TaxID=56689 RepID=UPI002269A66A|nr:protein DpdD [Mycolicibacterium mucogenicum]MCX8557528.1 protein DpdD [Mycolicibacterium mucogenicum]